MAVATKATKCRANQSRSEADLRGVAVGVSIQELWPISTRCGKAD